MSADNVIYFPKVLQILEFDSNRTVRDDDDDVVSVVMILIF